MFSLRFFAKKAKTGRIGALSDGIFAIVMTLLVLELAVPEIPKLLAAEQLHLKLLEMWPKFAAFVLSFIMLGILWTFHHIIFQHIKLVNEKFIWINILYLMFISLIPFSTALLGEFTWLSTTAVVFYGANLLLLSLTTNLMWWYVTKNKNLLNEDVSNHEITQLKKSTGATSILLMVTIGLSFISPFIGIAVYILIVLWGIIGEVASKTYRPDEIKNK